MSKVGNTFLDKLIAKWKEGKFVCVGLDSSDLSLLRKVVDDTHDLVVAFKPNIAFYEAEGLDGWKSLEDIIKYIRQKTPDVPIILDAKIADTENTNAAYGKAIFDKLGVDALTVNPYPGKEALKPLLDYQDKGIIVWVGASNLGSSEFQELLIENKPLYQIIAEHVAQSWNDHGNLAVVVGATFPDKLKRVREIVGDMPILIPGIGAQGGDLAGVLRVGLNSRRQGLIINSSRAIINSPDPRKATQDLHSQIQEILQNV